MQIIVLMTETNAMSTYEPYHVRLKQDARDGTPEVFGYDEIPRATAEQICQILERSIDGFGQKSRRSYAYTDGRVTPYDVWKTIYETVAFEIGFSNTEPTEGYKRGLFIRIKDGWPKEERLSAMEIAFRTIESAENFIESYRGEHGAGLKANEAIGQLNIRLRRGDVGYAFVDGKIIRVDSELLHSEAVEPALHLLHDAGFADAEREFLEAHRVYRQDPDKKQALVSANNAYESTMKHICDERSWSYPSGASASDLVQIMIDNQLVDKWSEQQLNAVKNMLDSSINTVRNKKAGHGPTPNSDPVPEYLVRYGLNMAASNIVMLVEAHNAKPR
jgi:hypothetical protein